MTLLPKCEFRSLFFCLILFFPLTAYTAGRSPAPVAVIMPSKQVMPEEILVTGTLLANEWVGISPEVAGIVKSFPVAEGTQVQKGDLILTLNDSLFAAEFRQAQASYDLAQIRHQRNQRLLRTKAISQAIYDESAAELNEQKAALEVAEVKLAKTRITAPFDGYITFRNTSEGAYITPGEQLFVLVDDTPLKLEFRVPERLASHIKPNSSVRFEVNTAGESHSYEATIQAVQPAISPNSRTLLVRAVFANEHREILAGAFAKIHLRLGGEEPILVVPAEALIGTQGGYKVYIVNKGKAQSRNLTTGVRRNDLVAVTSGLEEGLPVIISGHQLVRDGVPVKVIETQAETP